MKQMTGKEFEKLINKYPSWCKDLKEPLEITTFTNLRGSNITYLSPLLTFSGKNEYEHVATFGNCKNLKVATGTYLGFVTFKFITEVLLLVGLLLS